MKKFEEIQESLSKEEMGILAEIGYNFMQWQKENKKITSKKEVSV